jgi:hypothetical protein
MSDLGWNHEISRLTSEWIDSRDIINALKYPIGSDNYKYAINKIKIYFPHCKQYTKNMIIRNLLPTIEVIEEGSLNGLSNKFIINFIKCCKSLKKLVLPSSFNTIITIPNRVTHLTFGRYYNKPTTIPDSVTHLTFGRYYNKLTALPNSVTHLIFGHNYDQPTTLPNSITHLIFGACYNQITILSDSITHLIFGTWYNRPTTLPNSITYLIFGEIYNYQITLPNSVTHLIFGEEYNHLIKLPKSIIIHNLKPSLIVDE